MMPRSTPMSKAWSMRNQTSIPSSHSGEGDMEPHDEHIEYIKQAASRYLHTLGGLRAKLMDYYSYLYTLDGLDDCLKDLLTDTVR